MEKINGISFEDWAAASAHIAHGTPFEEVLKILGIEEPVWEDTNKKWGEKMADLGAKDMSIMVKYGEIFQNPKVGKFANTDSAPSIDNDDDNTDNDCNNSDIKKLMREANSLQHSPTQAVVIYKKAIKLMDEADDDDYDYDNLYAHYFVMKSEQQQTGEEHVKQAVHYAEKCLEILEPDISAGNIWHYTEEGQFQEEVIRVASNTVAWNMMKDTNDNEKLEEALGIIDLGIDFADDNMPPEYYLYMFDTKVRILLKMKETHEAYCVVYTALDIDPHFSDFDDIKNTPEYNNWLNSDEFKQWLSEMEEDDDDDDWDW